MSQHVDTFPESIIKEMQKHYTNKLTTEPPGAIFRAKTEYAVITAYKSGKVLFQGKSPEVEVSKWQSDNTKTTKTKRIMKGKNKKTLIHSFSPPRNLFISSHIGTDEAGTGDYFGPITVAAAYVQEDQIETLKSIGVRDSKNITDQQIRKTAQKLMDLKIPYVLHVLPNEKYNQLQKNGWTQGKMKTMMHHHAIKNLTKKIGNSPLSGILIDQFCQPNVFKKHLATENEQLTMDTFFMTKAESYSIAVAAASIIARTKFLTEMDRLSNEIGTTIPKGASSKVDRVIADIIRRHGESALTSCAKVHFANTKKAYSFL